MKHFIHLRDFSKREIAHIFELADKIKADAGITSPLNGKTIVMFFPESSIRTRVSFEKGIQMLGGNTILFPPETLDKKEDIKDVIGYLENLADMVIVRHKDLSLIEYMVEHSNIPIINAAIVIMTAVLKPLEIFLRFLSFSLGI